MTHTHPDPRRHHRSAAAGRAAGRRAATVDVTLSLAGRTESPVAQAVPVRSGGFGGAEGLAAYLRRRAHRSADRRHPSLCRADLGQCRRGRAAGRRAAAGAAPPGLDSRSTATAGPMVDDARRGRRGARRRAAPRLPGARPAGDRGLSRPRRSTPISSAASIRSSRRSPCPMRPTSWRAGRFAEADERALLGRARHRRDRRQEQRRRGDLRQDRRGARARHRR